MARVIDSLLIGLGFQTDNKSFSNAEGSIDSIKSKALQLGSVLAGAFGAKALTFDFAATNDELGKFSERWGIAANDVAAYDRALQHAGGSQGEFLGTVESLSKAIAKAPFEKAAIIGESAQFGISNQVSSILNATDALDGFLRSADALNQLSGTRREKFIEALGFSDAEVRLLSTGREEIEKLVASEKRMSPVTGEMTATAAAFNDQWQDLTTNLTGFSNQVAQPLTSAISDIIAGMNDWIEANRETINSFVEFGTTTVADNIEVIGGALLLLTGAKTISGLKAIAGGLGMISKNAGTASKSMGLMSKAATVLIGAEIVSNAGQGGALSSSSLFGQNALTEFLDTPIADLFSSLGDSVTSIIGEPSSTPSQSYITQPPVKVDVYLDGKPVRAIVDQRIEENSEQVIQDFTTSNGG